jgi:hypothetical protein
VEFIHRVVILKVMMTITMHDNAVVTLTQLEAFTKAADMILFCGARRTDKYAWIQKLLTRFFYFHLRKRDKVTVRRYIMTMTGYSDAQVTRLIRQYKISRQIVARGSTTRSTFPTTYTPADVAVLLEVDDAHGRLSGPATKQLCQRAYDLFGDERFVRLKHISVSHLYNLRGTRQYRSQSRTFTKTRPTVTPIGERRKPYPEGKPGFIRVDSVHQGDLDKAKGVYHINLVDEVTQWELVGCVEGISEVFLTPLLEALLKQFPFRVIVFHSDNGSEYINYVVAKLLNKLTIDQTKSRPRTSNDNALVESKNGSIIRKHMGYTHIPRQYAPAINTFYQTHFNTYVNFHRPSGYATTMIDKKGKEKKVYQLYETPYAHLQGLPQADTYLKAGITFEQLDQVALAKSDLICATLMQAAKYNLFKSFRS